MLFPNLPLSEESSTAMTMLSVLVSFEKWTVFGLSVGRTAFESPCVKERSGTFDY